MRFLLDHDVPTSCRSVLTNNGHDAWTVGEAGRATAVDDDQTVYAMDMGAVMVTIDKEFTTRRRRNAIGLHVRIKCPEPDAALLLGRLHDDMVPILEHHENVTIELKPGGLQTFHNWD